jgi:hypothetical protein
MQPTLLWLILGSAVSLGASFEDDFAADPSARGWKVHGVGELFRWNPSAQHLEVTWDSSKPNSYYYRPLGTVLGKDDDFQLRFDLRLDEVRVGLDAGKPFTFQVAVGLTRIEDATGDRFLRGTGAHSANLVEFNYFPDTGFGATVSPVIVSSNHQFIPSFSFPLELTRGDLFHIEMSYRAEGHRLETRMTRAGETFGPIKEIRLGPGFTDFRVDAVAISSYSDEGAGGSLLARGVIDNISLVWPDAPQTVIEIGLVSTGWQIRFEARTNWHYTLERSEDLQTWTAASPRIESTAARLAVEDALSSPASGRAFYRVRANR